MPLKSTDDRSAMAQVKTLPEMARTQQSSQSRSTFIKKNGHMARPEYYRRSLANFQRFIIPSQIQHWY